MPVGISGNRRYGCGGGCRRPFHGRTEQSGRWSAHAALESRPTRSGDSTRLLLNRKSQVTCLGQFQTRFQNHRIVPMLPAKVGRASQLQGLPGNQSDQL